MKYLKDGKVYDFNELQVKQGISDEYEEIADEEAESILNPPLTDEEQAQKIKDDKWTEYYEFENSLTIDIVIDENTTHTYNASPDSLIKIERKAVSAYTTEVSEILWVEDNDSFMTNKVELEMVILQADKLLQEKITELFGETV